MSNPLTDLLAEKGTLLADGATGTNLFNMGLTSGDAPELWNTEEPAKITTLYKGAVDAGSDLFLTNSFGANASRLKLHDAARRAHELSRVSAEIAREVADTAGRKVIVAGSVGPTGEIMEPVGTLSHALAVEMFHETADGLKAGGADVGWLETISAPEEYRAAAEGFALADLPWCGTMSFDTAGRTMMGVTSADMVKMVEDLGDHAPMAFGANCGTGASDLLRTILGFAAQGSERPIIAKGNAGIPKYVDGHIHYDGTPELMADYAVMARACGASIIGGCCGTMPEHLRHMREALDTRVMDHPPALEEIVDRLGAFSSAADGTEADTDQPTRRSSRRRRKVPA
jgi:5-methyltetrahydrofolate--homocysteine methyltransferase